MCIIKIYQCKIENENDKKKQILKFELKINVFKSSHINNL